MFVAESVLLCVNTKSTYQGKGSPRKAGYIFLVIASPYALIKAIKFRRYVLSPWLQWYLQGRSAEDKGTRVR